MSHVVILRNMTMQNILDLLGYDIFYIQYIVYIYNIYILVFTPFKIYSPSTDVALKWLVVAFYLISTNKMVM
jgi:hypothetical protein